MTDILTAQPKRLQCRRCLRPQNSCICQWIRPTSHTTEILILQHPMEVHQAKGSARLLHLSLPHSRLVVGESFDDGALRALLFEPFPPEENDVTDDRPVRPLLLYPIEDAATDNSHSLQPHDSITDAADSVRHRLVVLDGTWRKSRKMLHLNPLLQQLPRLALQNSPASNYRIRKAHRPDQLSTYEATCHALTELEGDAEKYRPLLQAFEGFVAQQQLHVMRHTPG
jgi:DTW domain-containing protein YfiP